jgi:hypothetical protein
VLSVGNDNRPFCFGLGDCIWMAGLEYFLKSVEAMMQRGSDER